MSHSTSSTIHAPEPGSAEQPVPVEELPPFDSHRLRLRHGRFLKPTIEWRGQALLRIHLHALERVHVLTGAVLGGFVLSIPGAWLIRLSFDPVGLSSVLLHVFVGLPVAVIVALILFRVFAEREVIIDTQAKTLQLRRGRRRETFELSEITGFTVLGHKARRRLDQSDSDSPTSMYYSCEVLAETVQGTRCLLKTEFVPDKETAYSSAAALTGEIAATLRVPWTWHGFV